MELTAESRKLYTPPREVQGFIDANEVEYCNNLYLNLPVFEPASHNRATRKDHLMYDVNDPRMSKLFLPKLQSLFPGQELIIDGGNFTEWHDPVKIHTDGHQLNWRSEEELVSNQQVLGYAVLIPLTTDTDNGTPHTVYFDQCYFGQNIDPKLLTEPYSKPPVEGIDQYTNCEFTDDYTGLEHNGHERLFGFSRQGKHAWSNGNALIWHRSQFHCAENFNQYANKRHIIFLVDFKYQQ